MSEPQHMAALRQANAVRLAGKAVKREVAEGRLSIAEALTDERSASLEITALLMAQRRWGPDRTADVLADLGIRENKRVDTLTARQRGLIAEACPLPRAVAA